MKNYFEGWYFKQLIQGEPLIFIPGFHCEAGIEKAFIQMIYRDEVTYFEFDKQAIVRDDTCYIEIEGNRFSKEGISLDLKNEEVTIKGNIQFTDFTPITYKIMGPFSYVPFMECKHEVLSLYHRCQINLEFNSEQIIGEGLGYLEKDWGTSFPKRYCWLQANDFNQKASVFVAIASIDYSKISFTGILGIVYYENQEIRFATYLGAKVLECSEQRIVIKQNGYELKINLAKKQGVPLPAPINGQMTRTIHEATQTAARFQLYHKNSCLFDQACINTSVEMAGMNIKAK